MAGLSRAPTTSGRKPMTTASSGRCSGAAQAFVVWQDEPLTDEVKEQDGRGVHVERVHGRVQEQAVRDTRCTGSGRLLTH